MSERALITKRVFVEIEYLKALCEELKVPVDEDRLDRIKNSVDVDAIKTIESYTHHDVKAVEIWIRDKMLEDPTMDGLVPLIHFGLTSQDVNHSALPMMLNDLRDKYTLIVFEVLGFLGNLADQETNTVMLSHTHGQPATPTTFGKEMNVYIARIKRQLCALRRIEFAVKLGGASGTLAAHYAAYLDVDWVDFMNRFATERLKRPRNMLTTQINHYDEAAEFMQTLGRIGSIMRDLCQDMWLYVSKGYIVNVPRPGEVGSSTMPHKTNPIHFENAEGNIKIAQALFETLSRELPVSRMQRDLCDSTMSRNIGVAACHLWVAITSMRQGFSRVQVAKEAMREDLMSHWEILTELVQVVLRREGHHDAYEKCKEASRGKGAWDRAKYAEFITGLTGVSQDVKSELLEWSPDKYLGFISADYSPV